MSWRDAPLYVEAHDLAVWVLERAAGWDERPHRLLAERASGAAAELVVLASLALTFPRTRPRHLEQLDEGIVRLRTELRLAERLGGLSPRQLRFAAGRLAAIGKMLGGWRKRVERRARRGGVPNDPPAPVASAGPPDASMNSGEGPPPAGV